MLGFLEPESPPSDSVTRLLDRLKAAIAELGYDAVIEDLSSADVVGGEDSLLASQDVMVIPGYLEDAARPILLAATKGRAGNSPRSFTKIMHQIKARLIESRGATQTVIVFCDCWDSASFDEEHAEELQAFASTGIRHSEPSALDVDTGTRDRWRSAGGSPRYEYDRVSGARIIHGKPGLNAGV